MEQQGNHRIVVAAIIIGVCIVAGSVIHGSFNRYAIAGAGDMRMYRVDKKTGKLWHSHRRAEYIVRQKKGEENSEANK